MDDGSTDGTAEVVAGIARQDSRIRLLRQDRNRGAQAARNAGIRASRGNWVCFLDSDDRYLPDSIERRLRIATEKKVSVVHSECYVQEGTEPLRRFGVRPVQGASYDTLLRQPGPAYPSLLVCREAFERIGYLDESIEAFQEWDTAIRLAKHYEFGFEPEPTFIYDCRGGDTMSKDFLRAGRGYLQILHKHFLPMLWHGGPANIASHYKTAGGWYAGGGDLTTARHCERKAMAWTAIDRPSLVVRKLQRILGRALGLIRC